MIISVCRGEMERSKMMQLDKVWGCPFSGSFNLLALCMEAHFKDALFCKCFAFFAYVAFVLSLPLMLHIALQGCCVCTYFSSTRHLSPKKSILYGEEKRLLLLLEETDVIIYHRGVSLSSSNIWSLMIDCINYCQMHICIINKFSTYTIITMNI